MSALTHSGPTQGGERCATHTRRRIHHVFGFWATTVALLLTMGFSAVPTPLYVLYQRRDHFSTIMLTVVYAVYAVGVIVSLFFGGHVSDWVGRKRVLVPALLVSAASSLIFLFSPGLPGLLVARVVSGVSVGLTTATATAYLAELHIGVSGPGHSSRRAQVVATAANLGGIGVGPLISGLLAQYAPQPLRLPFILFAAALFVLAVLVSLSPETADRPAAAPRYRPQRIAVPARARSMFFLSTAAGMAAFAVFGVFNSLAPTFLAETMHETSHAVAGTVAFAAFAAGAAAQVAMSASGPYRTLRTGPLVLVPGLALLMGGMWLPSLAMFVAGGVLTGAGGGLVFRGALTAAESTGTATSRAEVLAGFFLGAYVGLSVPVVGLGVATQYLPARAVMLVFAVMAAIAVVLCCRSVSGRARVTGTTAVVRVTSRGR